MNRKSRAVVGAVLGFVVGSALCVMAEEFRSPVVFMNDVNFDAGAVWKINGTKVTATASDLNSGLASSTASSVSNVNLKVFGSNITTVAGGTVTINGAVTLGSTLTSSGKVNLTPVANVDVTNKQTVTLSGVINYFTSGGNTNGATNIVYLAAPSAAGQLAILYCGHASTNIISIAGTGTYRGSAIELLAGESAILFAPTATNWAGVAQ